MKIYDSFLLVLKQLKNDRFDATLPLPPSLFAANCSEPQQLQQRSGQLAAAC